MNPVRGFLLVAAHALTRCLRGPRVVGLLLLAAFPVLLALLQVTRGSGRIDFDDFSQTVVYAILQVTVPFAALLLGVAVLGDEIEGRTITYLFTRPVPRPAIYLGRLAGFVLAYAAVLVLTVVLVAALYAERVGLDLAGIAGTAGIAVLGFATYTAFFAALRALWKRALFVGFMLTFILEVWISKMPFGNLPRWTVWHHLALLFARLFGGRPMRFEGMESLAADETAAGSLAVLAGILLVSLAVGAWVVRSREVRIPAAVG